MQGLGISPTLSGNKFKSLLKSIKTMTTFQYLIIRAIKLTHTLRIQTIV